MNEEFKERVRFPESPLSHIKNLVPVSQETLERLTGKTAQERLIRHANAHREEVTKGRERMAKVVLF